MYDVHDWVAGVAVITVGTALTVAAFETMSDDSGCEMHEVTVEGIAYYRCGSHWYTRVLDGGTPSYVVVKAPPGH